MSKPDWSCPDAQLVLPADARRDLWLAERRRGIGGSDISQILGLTKYGSAYSVWLDKTGKSPDKEETPQMRWGKLHEPAMRQAFTEDTGLAVRRVGLMRHKGFKILQVTPDGLVEDGGVFEAKTGSFRVLEDWSDEQISDHAHLQVTHSMVVTGRRHAHVVALIDGYKWHVRRVEFDPKMWHELSVFLLEWWGQYVVRDIPPPVTDTALEDVKEHFRVAEKPLVFPVRAEDVRFKLQKLKDAKAEEKEAEKKVKTIEAELRLIAGDADVVEDPDGELLTLRNDGTFSPSRFAELVPSPPMKKIEVPDMDAIKAKFPDEYRAARARVLRPKAK